MADSSDAQSSGPESPAPGNNEHSRFVNWVKDFRRERPMQGVVYLLLALIGIWSLYNIVLHGGFQLFNHQIQISASLKGDALKVDISKHPPVVEKDLNDASNQYFYSIEK